MKKKSISIYEDAKKPIEITHDGKKRSRIKIGIDTSKLIPEFAENKEMSKKCQNNSSLEILSYD